MNTHRPRRFAVSVVPLLCGLLLATAGCSFSPGTARNAPAGHVTVTTQASVLPGQGYAWVPLPEPTTAPERDARVRDEQFRADLQAALDRALQAKGYRPVDRADAAFLVANRVGVRDVRETQPVRAEPAGTTPMSAIKCTGGNCSQLVVSNDSGEPVLRYRTTERTEGGLMIEVIEPRSIRVVWSALNTGTIRPGEWTQARLDAVAAQTLSDLPAYRP
ncbi:DUF4136 domain-containing protein [Pseudoxanthomonas koreensis]|uniref:DUF4136 domain-containing protein n=1 Tax=Pseudoxanthomonas koreensis TaxID=266061 RepID=UPI001391F32E|nr:DUF4136 domain-containing protein [Pseudoxanthomonas koreensis]